jgi:hypothetical protein
LSKEQPNKHITRGDWPSVRQHTYAVKRRDFGVEKNESAAGDAVRSPAAPRMLEVPI